MGLSLLGLTILVVLVLDVVTVLTVIFLERRNPDSVIAWLFAIVALPIVGVGAYLIFGFKYFKARDFRTKSARDRSIYERVTKGQEPGLPDETSRQLPALTSNLDMARMLWADGGSILTTGNSVDYFTSGDAMFAALFEAIAHAKHHIHLEYYLLQNDALVERLLTTLEAKAKEGVEVRLLYDDLGNKVPRLRYRRFAKAGGHVSSFYRGLAPAIGFRINYRNHRKIAVIDGALGFIGGFNLGEDYLGLGPLGAWRDTTVRIRGDAVKGLQLRFSLDWHWATKEDVPLLPAYFPKGESTGTASIQIVSGGPDTPWDPPREQYLKMVYSAKRTCYLQTPYFIPDSSILTALRMAALSGVDVRVMIPTKPDHPLVHWANLSNVGELLEAGVRVFSYDDGFLHAKTITVDDIVTSVGSTNWDLRSFKWNFESNAIIYDAKLGVQYRGIFEQDMMRCTEITREAYGTRPRSTRIKESLCRLMSGVL